MAKKVGIGVGIVIVLMTLAVLAASQTRTGQNIYYAANYERTLDRYAQEDTTMTNVTSKVDPDGREAQLLSAFFGIDDALPFLANLAICTDAAGMDGMPVIFSHEVDLATLDPGDFRVTSTSGAVGTVDCVTLAPADDPGELRTALLVGQFGDPQDQPQSVEITGNVLSSEKAVNFKGAAVEVTPLEAGPSLVLAEIVPDYQWDLDREATPIPFGGGSSCPTGTAQILRVTWEGGITKPGGAPAEIAEGRLYAVEIEVADGSPEVIAPFALADTGDGDNNHMLCLNRTEPVLSVSFPAGYVTDPRDDLNPATSVEVTR
ncbi:MAG: hypothetical protein AAF697_12045 [Pseudomonadota bacterium]